MTTPQTPDRIDVLFERHVSRHGYTRLTAEDVNAFVKGEAARVLFFSEDPVKVPESWDVAVLLPEILTARYPELKVGLLRPEDSRQLGARYGVTRWPAMVFLREGGWLGTLEGMRDWEVFVREVPQMLARPVSRLPGVGIPVVSATAPNACH